MGANPPAFMNMHVGLSMLPDVPVTFWNSRVRVRLTLPLLEVPRKGGKKVVSLADLISPDGNLKSRPTTIRLGRNRGSGCRLTGTKRKIGSRSSESCEHGPVS